MYRFALCPLVLLMTLTIAQSLEAHCQVPCGVYGDQRRFEEMLEDTRTIAKAMVQINELAGSHDAQAQNQLARWVATKEAHAANTQKIVADYFMAQRIKADKPNYVKQLTSAHSVITSAMKCKQQVDAASAKNLEQAILNLYRAYEGKEPQFHE